MFGIGARLGTLAIAASLLYVAYLLHRSRKPAARHAGVAMSFVAGLAFLVTFVGEWMSKADWLGGFAVAGLIVCLAIVAVDWLWDKKPDKPAFWAAFALALFIVLGSTNMSDVGSNISDGGKLVGEQLEKIDDQPKPAAK
ncbi:hypothetical protein [Plantactinospora sp. WMMB782]|uniref:hypothetical protein n=1 Tax=Plantactinospora sp. WMMB782 TaxID=3404121 RepID=UPI003B93FF7D